jgi:hypothetical protein
MEQIGDIGAPSTRALATRAARAAALDAVPRGEARLAEALLDMDLWHESLHGITSRVAHSYELHTLEALRMSGAGDDAVLAVELDLHQLRTSLDRVRERTRTLLAGTSTSAPAIVPAASLP